MKKYRIKKGIRIEESCCLSVFLVQVRLLGVLWITVKEYVEEYYGYPEWDNTSAAIRAQRLLSVLEAE